MKWDGPARDKLQHRSVGVLHNELRKSRVLLVGAGGIGCELLKDLVKSGFGEIHIIDLDTIDLSNLNRQFLFRHEHIKKPKALVAKEVAQKFDPRTKIIAYHANIKDEQYGLEWFSSFRIVFNALDNIDARRHVNRMCLAADVPLIESGTTGFNGNVQVIKKGKTACYDCKEKQVPKSFPVCTVRSTPSQPIHTIVWAKSYLLPELFGVSEDEVADMDNTVDSENAEEITKLKQETEELRKLKESVGSPDFAQMVFDKAYKQDVERLLSMEDFWKDKKKPQTLQHDSLSQDASQIQATVVSEDQRCWSLAENFVVFNDSIARLSKRILATRATAEANGAQAPVIEFDKDDDDTLDFVTAAANLRSAAFHIDTKSKFETKQMAGNIIPAIATTNAMTAALCVFQAYKVMRNELGRTKEIFLQRANMVGDVSDAPSPDCPTCSRAMVRMQVDLSAATVNDLMDVLKSEFSYGSDFNINHGSLMLYDYIDAEDDEDAAATRLATKLVDLDVKAGTSLTIHDDEGDDPRVDLVLFVENRPEGSEDLIKILHKGDTKLEIPRKIKTVAEPSTPVPTAAATNLKRKRGLDDDGAEQATPMKKTVKPGHTNGAITILDDDEEQNGTITEQEGAIVLD